MAAIAPPTGFFSTSKRSACDRCRKSKLRCPPREGDNQPCARCVRAGVECSTGYTQPFGRTRSTGQIHWQQQAHQREIRKAVLPSPSLSAAQNLTNHRVVNTATSWLPADANQPFQLPTGQDIMPTSTEETDSETWNDLFGAFLHTSEEHEADVTRSTGSGHQVDEFLFPDSNKSFDLQTPPGTGSSGKPDGSPQPVNHHFMPILGHDTDSTLSVIECHLQLSQLEQRQD